MQEEALKLVLLALEDGSPLSRKVLVLFVVQRLEPRFPQASKTSIGHVVQLLYRASCFKVKSILFVKYVTILIKTLYITVLISDWLKVFCFFCNKHQLFYVNLNTREWCVHI